MLLELESQSLAVQVEEMEPLERLRQQLPLEVQAEANYQEIH
jgi:hypothetical protein